MKRPKPEFSIENYYLMYLDLYELIIKSYDDTFVLDELKRYNESLKNGNATLPKAREIVISHICELVKTDMGLNLWKLCKDSTGATTMAKFNQSVHVLAKENNVEVCSVDISIPNEMVETVNKLDALRNKFIAHDDISREHAIVNIEKLTKILEFEKDVFNQLCISNLDERICPITDAVILSRRMRFSFGLGYLINK